MPTDWTEQAKATLKAELKRRGVSYADLATRLTADGHPIGEQGLANKISRGGFSAAFLLQCLHLIDAHDIRLR